MAKLRTLVFLFICIQFILSCGDSIEPSLVILPDNIDLTESYFVHIDLNNRSGDTFKVEMFLGDLSSDHDIIQFAAAVPGTYNISNAGRFVRNFSAFDNDGNSLASEPEGTNRWKIANPSSLHRITYEMTETFDSQASGFPPHVMGGTSIENDHVLLNAPMVIGYTEGLKERDYFISLSYPEDWTVGTAMPESAPNTYHATDFDHLADSPILLGQMTSSKTKVGDTDINIHVYSQGGNINSDLILKDVEQVFLDAQAFLGKQAFLKVLPTDQYDFLYHFGDVGGSVLGHSKSSVYISPDAMYSADRGVTEISAYGFFHIVTPLNIHSEIIGDFNFAVPTPSQHLWFYEGFKAWATSFMRYRNKSINLTYLLTGLTQSLKINDYYDPNFSLHEIGLKTYTKSGNSQFNNIYSRGSFVISLLDIRLLELSGGKKGMREVILELIGKFGTEKSFSEDGFFVTIVDMTYPEIEVFINDYIKGTEKLPIQSYYGKIGIEYNKSDFSFAEMSVPNADQIRMFEVWSKNQ